MTGVEQTPSSGQSVTWPEGSLSFTCCQSNLPVASSRHMTMPLSTGSTLPFDSLCVSRGLRGDWLLVPTKILPPLTIGPPYAFDPSLTTHLMFVFFFKSHSVGTFFSTGLTIFRPGPLPNMAHILGVSFGPAVASDEVCVEVNCQNTKPNPAATNAATVMLLL